MKEIFTAFRNAGVAEMEAIKVTDSFNDIINRLEKESAESKARFEKESARFDREIAINRVIDGILIASMVGLFTTFVV